MFGHESHHEVPDNQVKKEFYKNDKAKEKKREIIMIKERKKNCLHFLDLVKPQWGRVSQRSKPTNLNSAKE